MLNHECPLRIERWSLRLQEFDFTISHIKGTVNPADFLSRHPFDIKTSLRFKLFENFQRSEQKQSRDALTTTK